MNTETVKIYSTDYVWFNGDTIDMTAIYAEESTIELLEEWKEQGVTPLGNEGFVKMTELSLDKQNEFIELIEKGKI